MNEWLSLQKLAITRVPTFFVLSKFSHGEADDDGVGCSKGIGPAVDVMGEPCEGARCPLLHPLCRSGIWKKQCHWWMWIADVDCGSGSGKKSQKENQRSTRIRDTKQGRRGDDIGSQPAS